MKTKDFSTGLKRQLEQKISTQKVEEDNSTHSILMGHTNKNQSISSSFQMRKHGRREQILALFVKGVDVSIKDIATLLIIYGRRRFLMLDSWLLSELYS